MAGGAVIVGVGSGLSASLAHRFAREGMRLVLAARNAGKLRDLAAETGATVIACDAADATSVAALFAAADARLGPPDIVVFNASQRVRGAIVELDPAAVADAVAVTALGGFHVAREAALRMLPRGAGTIFLTGASASVKGFAQSSAFAMGKFALRGLAQSLARELHPRGVHVVHAVIDGGIRQGEADPRAAQRGPDGMLDPDAIAETYWQLHCQPRSAWSWEIELRPWVETF